MNLRRTRAVARKEGLHILRDPRSLAAALALPALMLLLFGWALSLDVDRIPTLIYDSDRTPESRQLVSLFEGSRYFQVLARVHDYSAIQAGIDRGACLVTVVIPRDFSRHLSRSRRANVQILIDGSDSNTAAIALGYAQSLLADYPRKAQLSALDGRAGRSPGPRVEARLRIWYNPDLESKNYLVPGLVAVITMIITSLLTSLTIAREWETGTMEQLLSTPVKPAELVVGKMSAYFVLGAVDTLIAILCGVTLFGVPLRGSVLLLALACFIFLFGALCWGILISATASSQLLAYRLGMVTSFLPAFLLSGFVFPIPNMPLAIQIPTHLVPARYFITILRGIFLKGVGIQTLALEIGLLGAFSALVFLAATHRLKRRMA
ncbi:MAG: ABC transporter permease [Acidobacteriota bacterium]